MILVTVGTQGPFDRMVRAFDRWAQHNRQHEALVQIGAGAWKPTHVRWTEFLEPALFRQAFESAELIVSHAGIGTLIAALELGKPIVVMPRRAGLREHRNDHQLATAEHFCRRHRVPVATSEEELSGAIDETLRIATHEIRPFRPMELAPSPTLLERVRGFIEATPGRERAT